MVCQVKDAIDRGVKIIFVDEAIFSPKTRMARTWSASRSNVMTPDIRNRLKTQAVVAGISLECGLEAYMIKELSIEQGSFIEFLRSLREVNVSGRLAIFMDNLRVHYTNRVK